MSPPAQSADEEEGTPDGPEDPSREWLRLVLMFTAAVAFSVAATAFPKNAVWPTLAFFSWAFLLTRVVIEFPGEFGLIPEVNEADGEGQTQDPNASFDEDE